MNKTLDYLQTISHDFDSMAEKICEQYCRYPFEWDEDKEQIPFTESDICKNCPLNIFEEKLNKSIKYEEQT